MSDTNVDVVIIGAGLAGLSAAVQLKQAGVSFVVLEARDRVGGRTHSAYPDSGGTIDQGAQFIGDVQTRISKLVDDFGLTRVAPHEEGIVIHRASPSSPAERMAVGKIPLSLLSLADLAQASWRMDRLVKGIMRGHDEKRVAELDAITLDDFVNKVTFGSKARHMLKGILQDMCVPLEQLSAYEALENVATTGGMDKSQAAEQWFLAEGTQAIAEKLAASVVDSLILNAPVSAVEVDQEKGVLVKAKGTIYNGSRVIVAVPPQLYGDIGLLPLLPSPRREVVDSFTPGLVIKTVLVWDEPWWRADGLSGMVRSAGGDIFQMSYDTSGKGGSPGTLVLFSTGNSAVQLASAAPSEKARIAKALGWLEHNFGCSVPTPRDGRSTNWMAEPRSIGGYASRRAVGGWAKAPGLFAPLGRIHFAGSETANEWRCFMEGALQSGERAAQEVLTASELGPPGPEGPVTA